MSQYSTPSLPLHSIFTFLTLITLSLAYPTPLSFPLPRNGSNANPETMGCCQFGGVPLPVSTSRKLPALIGLGIHKASTSYLFNLLKLHPEMKAPANEQKELYMFGEWPVSHLSFAKYLNAWDPADALKDKPGLLYEITATYLHTPGAACRIRALVPDAKFVVVLRDPVSRAVSHWNMQMDFYREGYMSRKPPPLQTSVTNELNRLKDTDCAFNTGRPTKSWNDCFKCFYINREFQEKKDLCTKLGLMGHQAPAIDSPCKPVVDTWMLVSYGIYAAPIAWWLEFFPPERFMFLNNEELNEKPVEVANRVMQFMGYDGGFFTEQTLLDKHEFLDENKHNSTLNVDHPSLAATVAELKAFFKPQIRDLYYLMEQIGVDFPEFKDWPKAEVMERV